MGSRVHHALASAAADRTNQRRVLSDAQRERVDEVVQPNG